MAGTWNLPLTSFVFFGMTSQASLSFSKKVSWMCWVCCCSFHFHSIPSWFLLFLLFLYLAAQIRWKVDTVGRVGQGYWSVIPGTWYLFQRKWTDHTNERIHQSHHKPPSHHVYLRQTWSPFHPIWLGIILTRGRTSIPISSRSHSFPGPGHIK